MIKDSKNLAQDFKELSTIIDDSIPIDKWVGAVNLIIVDDHILFIKRSDSMPTHKGQIAFVGGHKNKEEIEPKLTAFREFREETNIDEKFLSFQGYLDPVFTARTRVIIPVVSKLNLSIDELFNTAESNGEWSQLICSPIKDLFDVDKWQTAQVISRQNYRTFFCSLSELNCKYSYSHIQEHYVLWGATAKMIWSLFKN